MKKRFSFGKRALALALSMVMCVGMLQVSAFAEESENTSSSISTDSPSSESNPVADDDTGSDVPESNPVADDDTGSDAPESDTANDDSDSTASEPNAITDTGVLVEVTEKEPTTDEDTNTSTEGWTASGEDEKGVTVEIDSTTTTTVTDPVTDADGNVTEPGKTETTTEIETILTDKGELDLDNATPEKGKEPTLTGDGKKDLDSENTNLKVDLEVSATVRPGEERDEASGTTNDITDQILNIIQNDSGLNDCQDGSIKFGDKKDNGDGSYTYEGTTLDGKETVTITIFPDGRYTKTTRTETITDQGDFEEVGRGDATTVEGNLTNVGHSNSTENPLPEVPTEIKPEVPEVGAEVNRGDYTEIVSKVEQNENTGVYTITYEYQLPVLDADGKPVVDEDGNPVTTTETRTETLSGTSSTTTTEQVVTEKREDKVTITEVTVEKKVELGDGKGGGTSLDLSLSMEPVEYEFGKGGHGTLYQDEDTEESGSWIPDNETGADSQKTELKYLEEKFGLITIDDVSSTKVTVKQENTNDTSFKADIDVDLSLAKDKLTGNRLMLVVQQGDVTKTAFLNADQKDNNDAGIILKYDDNGQLVGVKFENVEAESFSLQLVGRQKLDENINAGDTNWAQINMTSNVTVKVSGITAQISGTTETKTGERIDTVTAERTETKTVISSSVTSVLEDFKEPVIPDPEQPEPEQPDPEQPDPEQPPVTPPTPPTGGDDTTTTPPTGGDDDDTYTPPVAVIPETEVPLVEAPEVDVPESNVPLAEEPVVEIPDEKVPLVEEVVIQDGDVPLAEVPKTGDISSLWYLTTLLSACGLAFLALRKKDN